MGQILSSQLLLSSCLSLISKKEGYLLAFETFGCGHFMFLGKPGSSLYLDSAGHRNPSFRDVVVVQQELSTLRSGMSNSCCFSAGKENMYSQALEKLLKKPCDTVKLARGSLNRYVSVYLKLVLLWAIRF